ncbi:MAG: hypothetical protein NT135_02095 [Candidatus Berkelbacteria bacterium]|nr:hypothetical protein [Candidatus Berkelbacteria bacterium]
MFSTRFRTAIFIIFLFSLFLTIGLGYYYYFFSLQRKPVVQSGPCSDSAIKTGPAAGNYEDHIDSLDFFNVNTCFLGFEDIQDNVFPGNSLRMTIGFYDKQGKLHSYPARIGGVDNAGRFLAPGFCFHEVSNKSLRCKLVTLPELRTALTKNTILEAQIIYGDNSPWLASSQTTANADTIAKLKEALKTGVNFPVLSQENNFVLQIWTLTN